MEKIKSFWLTLNRSCQLRCEWCYAETCGFNKKDDLALSLGYQIIDFCKNLGIKSCTLLGGEPLIYPNLLKILSYLEKSGIRTGIVTNGIALADKEKIDLLSPYVAGITVSLKAANKISFKKITKAPLFDKAARGIKNLSESSIPNNVSVLLSLPLLDETEEMITTAFKMGAKTVQVDTCNPTITELSVINKTSPSPETITRRILEINTRTKNLSGNVIFSIRTPFCAFPNDFIQELKEEDRLVSGCQLHRHDGLIFDPHGNVLACNLMSDSPLGKFGKDFTNKKSFLKFWTKGTICEFFEETKRLPSESCKDCTDFAECCGGCTIKWLYFDPKKYIKRR